MDNIRHTNKDHEEFSMTDKQLSTVIEHAKKISQIAHAGQKRRGGEDYFAAHVEPIANSVTDYLKPIAYLHDVIEDTEITLEELKNVGFPEYIIKAVELLTHRNNEPNESYWTKIAKNIDATTVKIADIKNNLMSAPTEKQRKKYLRAIKLFKDRGYSDLLQSVLDIEI